MHGTPLWYLPHDDMYQFGAAGGAFVGGAGGLHAGAGVDGGSARGGAGGHALPAAEV